MSQKILIVDDSAQIREGLSNLLGASGYEVTQANDGQEGLDIAREERFDLMIVDVNMPRLNGLDMITKVREDSLNAGTPAFVLTTESMTKFAETCEDIGADIWIVKPYHAPSLLEVVGHALA
jgi:two-component system chemotaxis response regulator CheY